MARIVQLLSERILQTGLLDKRHGTLEERQRILVEAEEWIPAVVADRGRIERVLSNLVSNALKYSPSDRPVDIRVDRTAGEIVVKVTNQGTGIRTADIPDLFQRYYRTEAGKKNAEGLGLGLYIASLTVEAHGGRVWVESEVGRGSTFGFALPLSDA